MRVEQRGPQRVFELPLNLAQIGPRATLVRRFVSQAQSEGSIPLVVDLGSRNGEGRNLKKLSSRSRAGNGAVAI